jgi:hypothetical protein
MPKVVLAGSKSRDKKIGKEINPIPWETRSGVCEYAWISNYNNMAEREIAQKIPPK